MGTNKCSRTTWRPRPVTLANPVTTFTPANLIYVGPAAAPYDIYRRVDTAPRHLDAHGRQHESRDHANDISGQDRRQRRRTCQKRQSARSCLSGANTYTGGTTLNAGVLSVSGAAAKLGTGNVTVQNTSTTVTSLSIESGVQNAIADTATLTLAGGGTAGVADQSYATLGDGVNELVARLDPGRRFAGEWHLWQLDQRRDAPAE